MSTLLQRPALPRVKAQDFELVARRLLDVAIAFAGLLCLAPLMALIALAIRIESCGPIFFSHLRLGQGGRHFRLYKFRKFHERGDLHDRAVTLENDARLTRVGKLLMETKLDELPQLWNVLKGDMSMVGPRPETLDFAECFHDVYQQILEFKPGLFGPNQVFFRNESALYPANCNVEAFYREVLFPLKARVDLAYFPYRNLYLDSAWIARGTIAVFGWSPFRSKHLNWVEGVEGWISRRRTPSVWQLSNAAEPRRDSLVRPPASIVTDQLSSHASAQVSRQPVVCVQGLGFAGAAMAIAVASARDAGGHPVYKVRGVDLPTEQGLSRIAALNRGAFPFATTDAKLEEKARQAHADGNLTACTDAAAFGSADTIIVDVPLDVRRTQAGTVVDLETFRTAIASVGRHMRADALVIIETTVPPGSTAHVAAPILKDQLVKRNLPTDRFKLAHSYERVMPGAAYLDSIVNMPRVYAGCDTRSAQACADFLGTVINVDRYPLMQLSTTTASELAKVLENTFRAVTIALMDEWASFAETIGIDLFEVVDSIRVRPTHSNIRTPGLGVGGYCLTKDPLMAQLAAREIFQFEHPFPFAAMAVDANRHMPRRALDRIKMLLGGSLAGRRVLLLGVSYREDVCDTRYSPSEIFCNAAKEEGAEVVVRDPLVAYWPEQGIEIPRDMPPASDFDAVVLAVPHKDYKSLDYERWLDGHHPLFFDTFNVLSTDQRRRLRALGCRVECIGRGLAL
jgi:UDP-N-acetyl-D-glucosamine dehydrogenase